MLKKWKKTTINSNFKRNFVMKVCVEKGHIHVIVTIVTIVTIVSARDKIKGNSMTKEHFLNQILKVYQNF